MQVQHFDEDQHVHITLDTKEKEFINETTAHHRSTIYTFS